jgi:hypothetical protein
MPSSLSGIARGRYRIPAELLEIAGIRHDVLVALIGTEDGRILAASHCAELAPSSAWVQTFLPAGLLRQCEIRVAVEPWMAQFRGRDGGLNRWWFDTIAKAEK